jgi:hypothetical protein
MFSRRNDCLKTYLSNYVGETIKSPELITQIVSGFLTRNFCPLNVALGVQVTSKHATREPTSKGA